MGTTVCKFGGTSLASAEQFRKVYRIVKADPDRRFIVPSAPGKRSPEDEKITDLFYACYEKNVSGLSAEPILEEIFLRYDRILADLGLNLRLESEFDAIRRLFQMRLGRDYFVSRGEYLNGIILANFLGYEFVDAAEVIFFREDGVFDAEKTDLVLSRRLQTCRNAVIPGFYGSTPGGTVKTFPRGGSDISGALVARAANADLYENWTDVNGFLAANPRLVENPCSIPALSYHELRELGYMGAQVLHEDAIRPVREKKIPLLIKNTNFPEAPGTRITAEAPGGERRDVLALGAKAGFAALTVEKDNLKKIPSFFSRFAAVFEEAGVSIELIPCAMDSVTAVVDKRAYYGREAEIMRRLEAFLPESVRVDKDLAILSAVGSGTEAFSRVIAVAAGVLEKSRIPVIFTEENAGKNHVLFGIPEKDRDNAVRLLYQALIEKQ